MICNDILFILLEDDQVKCIDIIFLFAGQKTDTTGALSAFELLWNIIPVAKTAEILFQSRLALIRDEMSDMSLGVVEELSARIASHWPSLPNELFDYLGPDYFVQIVGYLEQNNMHSMNWRIAVKLLRKRLLMNFGSD
jgi:hypothetical protein